VEHAPERCGGCGADLAGAVAVGVEARQVFDLPALRLCVVEHRAERRRCACGTTTAGRFPEHVRAAACYGPGVRALVCYLCVHQHLPVDRAAQLLDVLGASVATGTLAAVLAEGAVGLDGFLATVRDRLAAAPVAHFDETGARVAGRLHWVHSASISLLSLFTVHAKRGKVAMQTAGVLPGFAGVAVHDGWAPYWRFEDVRHALCGAHLLRELEAITEEPGQGWAAGMAELLIDAKLAADRARAADAGQVDDEVRARGDRSRISSP
jgi:transposase